MYFPRFLLLFIIPAPQKRKASESQLNKEQQGKTFITHEGTWKSSTALPEVLGEPSCFHLMQDTALSLLTQMVKKLFFASIKATGS